MSLLALLPGIALPTLIGWLILNALQGKTPVLLQAEQWLLGFALGLTFFTLCAFFGNILLGIPFTLAGFGIIGIALLVIAGIPWILWGRTLHRTHHEHLPAGKPSRLATIGLAVFGAWVALRVLAFSLVTLLTPSFFDDTTDNWNLRGKLFYLEQHFTLELPWGGTPGVSSYPPSVPLAKTWLSVIAGTWDEGLINSLHILWFLAAIALVYCTLRRMLPFAWAALGTALLASLPLELIQGTNAYADVFLSLHLFAAVMLMMHAVRSTKAEETLSWLRLAAFAIALVPFTKNEGWALYFPVLILLYGGTLVYVWRKKTVGRAALARTCAIAGVMLVVLIAPWIAFKVINGLAFGNAKGIDWQLQWQPNVLLPIAVNTFFEGNWNFLFPLFFGLLCLRWKTALRTPLLVLSAFFLIPYFGQFFAYLTTGLAQEAIYQTGYARGIIHLMPVIVTLTTVLLYDLIYGDA